ncbi:MAG: hypothetical protein M3Y69_01885 [Verrucomicrobiota bacterium]|nr:hypothetical protein [Verrucomicrobiota bacterium]
MKELNLQADMSRRCHIIAAYLTVAFATALCVWPGTAFAAPPQAQYTLHELGGRRANQISSSGEVVGSKTIANGLYHAAFWPSTASAPVDLGSLPGFLSTALDVNPRREIVGLSASPDFSIDRAVYWAAPYSAPVELRGVATGFSAEAYGINPAGQIVGQSFNAEYTVAKAVFWRSGTAALVYLRQLNDDFPLSEATGITPSGSIVGTACDASNIQCYVTYWASSTSRPVALASPAGEFIYTTTTLPSHSINNAGRIVGYAYNADNSATRAVFWASASSPAVILRTTGEFSNAIAASISENGEIVGQAFNGDFTKQHPFLWPTATSPGIDLTTFFPAGSNWDLDNAFVTSVNNRGEIVGSGSFTDGSVHNFVLVPVHGHQ